MTYINAKRIRVYTRRRWLGHTWSRSLLLDGLYAAILMKQALLYRFRAVKLVGQNRWKKMAIKKFKKMLDFLLRRRYNEFRR
jgi:hypothetical protein